MPTERFQSEVKSWMVKAFGEADTNSVSLRNWRFLEEALELVQAGGCTKEEAADLVAYVFDRPVGELPQEVGGVMVTLAGLCNAHHLRADICGRTELERCHAEIDKISAKHKRKPSFGPLPEKKVHTNPEGRTNERE